MSESVNMPATCKNPEMASKARQEILNSQFMKQEYKKWYEGQPTMGIYDFKMNNQNASFYAKSNRNNSIYEVGVSPSEGLIRAQINNNDDSIMMIQGNRTRSNTYHGAQIYDVDFENDGEVDYRFGVTYDDNGVLTRTLEDKDNDGLFDNECAYSYDEETGRLTNTYLTSCVNGNMVSQSNVEYFGNIEPCYGYDCKEKYTYWDDNGKPITTTKTYDVNGNITEVTGEGYTQHFTYDDQGRIQSEVYDDTTDDTFFCRLTGASNDYTKEYCYEENVVRTYDKKGKLYSTEPIE